MSESLWQRIQNDEIEAFNLFYKEQVSFLFNYGMKITNQKDIIQDCLQVIFTELWQNRKTINIKGNPRPYLYVSIRRAIHKELQKQGKTEDLSFESDFEFKDSNIEMELDAESRATLIARLNQAKQSLTKRQSEIIFLLYKEGLDYDEICQVMNLTKAAAYKLVNQAVKRLSQNI